MIAYAQFTSCLLLAQVEASAQRQWRILWNWSWPLWATALVIVAAVVWVLTIYFRENASAGKGIRIFLSLLRLTALALALLMFAQPALEWFRIGQPRLVLLVDRSASMGTLDRYDDRNVDTSRIATCKKVLTAGEQSLIEQWQSTYQLDVVAFDEEIDSLSSAEGPLLEQIELLELNESPAAGTSLGDAVDYALRELPGPPPVAIVLFTDGIATRGESLERAAERARRLRVPLYTVAVGSERRRPDIAVENLLVEEIVFPGDRLQVEATVRATGFAGKPVEVLLRDETTKRILARTNCTLPDDNAAEIVRLAIRPEEPGQLQLECFIAPQDSEADSENNAARQTVEVRDEKIRVLLVQSQPSYEYRALKSLLERDPAVELKVRLQEADADYHTIDPVALRKFPTSEQELFDYDVLLFGDADFGLLPRSVWPLVERFVTVHGGGLVCIAGPQYMPLAYQGNRYLELLLPVEINSLNPLRSQLSGVETFSVYPTVLGLSAPSLQLGETRVESQAIWQSLPQVSWLLRIQNIKPGAQVLAEHPGITNRQGRRLPVILRHYVGAGEVLFHATDETWRWRWRTDDRYFARYWGQVVRRLGRGRLAAGRQGIRVTADRSLYKPGEPVQLQARFRNPSQAPAADDQVVLQLRGDAAPSREVALQRRLGRRGLFSATVEDLAADSYKALLIRPDLGEAADSARFEIQQPPRELARVVVDRQALSQAARISGGRAYTVANVAQLSAELPPPRHQPLDQLPPRKLWNSNVLLSLFVLVLATEWILRRRYGML